MNETSAKPSLTYKGYIDWVASGFIRGWIYCEQTPNDAVGFSIQLDGKTIYEGVADIYRDDLEAAKIGNGIHGYCFFHQLSDEQLYGKTLQLCDPSGVQVGKSYQVANQPKSTAKVTKVHSEHNVLVYQVNCQRNEHLVIQLYYNNIRFWQGTKACKEGNNRIELPVCKEITDGKAHEISFGVLGNVNALHKQELQVSINALAAKRFYASKNNSNKPSIIMIDRSTPKPDQDAGSYAAVQEARLLMSLGFHIIFIPDDFTHSEKYTPSLQNLGIEMLFAPHFKDAFKALQANIANASAVYITRYHYVEKYIKTIRDYSSTIPIIFNNADLHFLREFREAEVLQNQNLFDKARKTRDREIKAMSQVDAILSYSDIEHAVISSHTFKSSNIFKCPWVVESPQIQTSYEERKDIAFLGGFDHPANVQAVIFFIENVMPALRAKNVNLKFFVYGSNMPNTFYQYASDDVILKGYADSLEDVFLQHRIFVAPLFFGAGVKGKVLAAAAHGLPCVLSDIAIEGTGLIHNTSAIVANTVSEWAKHITSLNDDKLLWERIVENQLKLIAQAYSFTHAKVKMTEIFHALKIDLPIE